MEQIALSERNRHLLQTTENYFVQYAKTGKTLVKVISVSSSILTNRRGLARILYSRTLMSISTGESRYLILSS